MNANELRQLADQHLSGTLDTADFDRLETLLQEPANRREYLRYCFLHGELACSDQVLRSLAPQAELTAPSANQPWRSTWCCALTAALLLCFIGSAFYWEPQLRRPVGVATLEHSSRVSSDVALRPGTFRLEDGEARIRFGGGADVTLAGKTVLGVSGRASGTLFEGQLAARMSHPSKPFFVETPSVRVVDLGTEFGVSVNDRGETEVHVFDGLVETQARLRLPRHYYSFDETSGAVQNLASESVAGELKGEAQRTAGLVGRGALRCADRFGSGVWLDSGADGPFDVSSGITIEVLIAPQWSGAGWSTHAPYDYDEIYRKEDGNQRVLLSFQNDPTVVPAIPSVPRGPCLAFGLNLSDAGYSELDMPLDGEDGRPTLAQLKDGKLHHIVATYDSHTGLKAIYVDGRLAFSTRMPSGTLIRSGGPGLPVIGNMQSGNEPFQGTIDEFAYYDFALTADEVAQHFAHVQAGRNYFGLDPNASAVAVAGGWKPTTQLHAGQARRFDAISGLPLGDVRLDRARFATGQRID